MHKMTISQKVVAGFSIVLLFTALVGACGIWGIKSIEEDVSRAQLHIIICIVMTIVAIAVGIGLAAYGSIRLAKIFRMMINVADAIAKGNVDYEISSRSGDEAGDLTVAFRNMASGLKERANLVERLADGDLTVEFTVIGDADRLGVALTKLVKEMYHVVSEITSSSHQVGIGARQVAEGSQSLAQGSAQQAAAVEELSSSVFEISLNTKENAKTTDRASELSKEVQHNASEGSQHMRELLKAVEEINESSRSIGKIIKVIDDIAFQTNMLALNAAVEAAGAGQYGKGFAVVAEEVRSLAGRSAAAAKDTAALIESSLEKASLGKKLADRTEQSLSQIFDGIVESSRLIDDIAKSAEEQSLAISQVNIGITQVAQVVNMNSATADKDAVAAEQLSAMTGALESAVSIFKLGQKQPVTNREFTAKRADVPSITLPDLPEVNTRKNSNSPELQQIPNDGFGKY